MGTIYSASICAVVASVSLVATEAGAAGYILTPTLLGTATTTGTVSTATIVTTGSASVPSEIVCAVGVSGNIAPNTITDSAGNTYTALATASNVPRVRFFRAPVTASLPVASTQTITYASSTNANHNAECYVFSGVIDATDSNPFPQTRAGSTAPSVTGTAPFSVYTIAFGSVGVSSGVGDSFTEASGWTSLNLVNGSSFALHVAYQITFNHVTPTYAPTLGTSRAWTAALASFDGVCSLATAGSGPC